MSTQEILSKIDESEKDEYDFEAMEKYEDAKDSSRIRIKDKSQKAITEKVMSAHVRGILLKLINSQYLNEVSGCISTGKEANVYYGVGSKIGECAIKIFKTEILDYKDRTRYIEGEHRFRHYNTSKNPRKMVRKWAEKEYRNLIRIYNDGISCPQPLKLLHNIIIMSFIGSNTVAYPTLKEATVDPDNLMGVFKKIIIAMHTMFTISNLVHADLSEYNILYDKDDENVGRIYIIDVSQAVQTDSPNSLIFLRQDIHNIRLFFSKRGLVLPDLMFLFNIITKNDTYDNVYDGLSQKIENLSMGENSHVDHSHEDSIFKSIYIPQNLANAIIDHKLPENNDPGSLAEFIAQDIDGPQQIKDLENDIQSSASETEDSQEEDELIIDKLSKKEKPTKEEIKKMRKDNKKNVKLENKEKRKEKTPKHIKKAFEKKLKRKN